MSSIRSIAVLLLMALAAVAGCGQDRRSYATADAVCKDYEKVYRPRGSNLAFEVEDLLVAVRGGKSALYVRPKGESEYQLLTAELQATQVQKKLGDGVRVTDSKFEQELNSGGTVYLRYGYGTDSRKKAGIESQTYIGTKDSEVVK